MVEAAYRLQARLEGIDHRGWAERSRRGGKGCQGYGLSRLQLYDSPQG